MKRILGAVVVLVACLLGVLFFRASKLTPSAEPSPGTESQPSLAVDTAEVAGHLAGMVKFPTVSLSSGGPIDTAAFLGLHQYLETSFPLVHSRLRRELVNGLSLVFTWPGRDSTLAPVVLMGHLDVVPVPEPNLPQWTHTPFSGDIADGFVWGRGTLDDKTTVLSILEAVESLLRGDYQPARTIYLAFGHDEEVGGRYGARLIAQQLSQRGVKPALVLDEGGFMAAGLMPGLTQRTAIVGIAEKGYLSLRLTAEAAGGHSSMPTSRTAVGALSRGIARLEAHQFPFVLDGPTQGMVEALAPYLPFSRRVMLANLWLTRPLVIRELAKDPLGAALLRTTTAPTMLSAGIKDNVLPPQASAVVNFRIRPGETVASVTARVTQVLADPRITVGPLDSIQVDPSPVSDVNSEAFRLVRTTVQAMLPGERPPVIPYLVMGGTDAKFWSPHSRAVFRFLPIPLGPGDRERVHGLNERVSLADLATSVGFFVRLIRGTEQLEATP